MFRYQVNKFNEAERLIRIRHDRDGFYVTLGDDKRITESTVDRDQVNAWQRVLTVQYALHLLGLPMSKTAGLLAQNAYSAFAYEIKNHG